MKAIGFGLGLAFIFTLIAAVLIRSVGVHRPEPDSTDDRTSAYRRELRSYIYGAVLAYALTGAAYALVYWSVAPRAWIFLSIGVLAFIQIAVHFRFFLHIDPPRQKVDDLHLMLFSALILTMMAGGTLWILKNLAARMH